MKSNRTRDLARALSGLAILALTAVTSNGCSSTDTATDGAVGSAEQAAIHCTQDDCTGTPGRPPCGIVALRAVRQLR